MNTVVHYSPKCINYRIFKTSFGFEKYPLSLPKDLRIVFAKMRTCNHLVMGETSRWQNIGRNLGTCTFVAVTVLVSTFIILRNVHIIVMDRIFFIPDIL